MVQFRAQSLEGDERAERLLPIAAISARYAGSQDDMDREIPIVRLTSRAIVIRP